MRHESSQSIRRGWSVTRLVGFAPLEVLLAGAVFALLVTALVGTYLYGEEATVLAGNRARAILLADEGLEVVRNIRDAAFANLTDGTYGLTTMGNQWNLSGSSDITGVFTRQIVISTVDAKRKSATSTVTWQQNAQRTGSVTLTSRMTNWQGNAPATSTCDAYAIQQGYSTGTCRQNTQQCTHNGEIYLSGGDAACVDNNPGNPSRDTCCVV